MFRNFKIFFFSFFLLLPVIRYNYYIYYILLYSWKEDATMGRQVLTGISPLVMEKCTSLPEYFNVTNDDVVGILEEKTLEEEMAVSE